MFKRSSCSENEYSGEKRHKTGKKFAAQQRNFCIQQVV
ncbi:hypothetical protein ECP029943810_4270 [Escherichia coli P0299438.10]|uniref:Uncharacterized protein n=1 Tax=Escherichia coli (strain SMS-3-5 / SECEC) TaxID=439855 RepID=B1LM09_ECOSM|nr:hypothetical protein EcSMS35_4204 [Escherichia coli SMS-3-5]AEE59150.1 hypothetical protein UMNK88_4651 [Escherichia coli UMNK88]EEJ44870.1 hypothetical protein HMPREF0358_5157 [Escherichia coli 83972]EHU17799.1 hypothetical protein ECDEC1D_4928 [Escherichia coli DEC1D]EHU20803.1 hypothetical protein ECDEC1E_4722 [Escherichia coli DEC1E]EHU22925.1 hypothetical protein ECDEC2A_4590 [Escherichia coli DEC2A]EHU34937.1 hypothetical protein ECDEC2B_4639 [Escherichia coli DEC2B]EHU36753.1 hypot